MVVMRFNMMDLLILNRSSERKRNFRRYLIFQTSTLLHEETLLFLVQSTSPQNYTKPNADNISKLCKALQYSAASQVAAADTLSIHELHDGSLMVSSLKIGHELMTMITQLPRPKSVEMLNIYMPQNSISCGKHTTKLLHNCNFWRFISSEVEAPISLGSQTLGRRCSSQTIFES
ncbi:hypothetical protein NPIL_314411 [Nephila pilipes]|uniref:Uncharacterized protein n=1 Tax=Nephila pilipes TaxID=299642 RepID=A0A8X6PFI4_NEPPI|nr:hypothetical protein NPIL_314411 [Nephila pilipes]